MKKRLSSLIIAISIVLSILSVNVSALENINAIPHTASVYVDNVAKNIGAFNIAGNNYFKLRDIAYVLSGTVKQFDVTWDGEKNAINLISNRPYTVIGGESVVMTKEDLTLASQTTAATYLDGEEIKLAAYNIEGNNYFKLRDVGSALNFGVNWDEINEIILITTSINYGDEIPKPVEPDPIVYDKDIYNIVKTDAFNLITKKEISVSKEFISAVDSALFDIESETGLIFGNISFPKLNIIISNDEELNVSIGAYAGGDGNMYLLSKNYIDTVTKNPFIIHHEGTHLIRIRNKYFTSSPIFEEGLADYMSNVLLRKIGYRKISDEPNAISSFYAFDSEYGKNIKKYSTKIENFFDSESYKMLSDDDPLRKYYMGEIFFLYLEDKYGSIKIEVYRITGNAADGLKELYGNDVFDGFAKWWEINESRMKNFENYPE